MKYKKGNYYIIEVSGSYEEMGFQYGSKLKPEIDKIMNILNSEVKKIFKKLNFIKKPIGKLVLHNKINKFYKSLPKKYKQEIKGFAKGANISIKQVLLASAFTEFSGSISCTSVLRKNSKKELIHGRNLDFYPPFIGDFPILIKYNPNNENSYTLSSILGYLPALTGINTKGVSASINQTSIVKNYKNHSIPVGYQIREILSTCQNIKEIDDLMDEYSSNQGWCISIISDNKRCIYNIAGKELKKHIPSTYNEDIFINNRFNFQQLNNLKTIYSTEANFNINREKTISQNINKIENIEDMFSLLTNTDYYTYKNYIGIFTVLNYMTVQSLVMLPNKGVILFSANPIYAGFNTIYKFNVNNELNPKNVFLYKEKENILNQKEFTFLKKFMYAYFEDKLEAIDLFNKSDINLFYVTTRIASWGLKKKFLKQINHEKLYKSLEELKNPYTIIPENCIAKLLFKEKNYNKCISIILNALTNLDIPKSEKFTANLILAKCYSKTKQTSKYESTKEIIIKLLGNYSLTKSMKKDLKKYKIL